MENPNKSNVLTETETINRTMEKSRETTEWVLAGQGLKMIVRVLTTCHTQYT
jgi:hypothetical protein